MNNGPIQTHSNSCAMVMWWKGVSHSKFSDKLLGKQPQWAVKMMMISHRADSLLWLRTVNPADPPSKDCLCGKTTPAWLRKSIQRYYQKSETFIGHKFILAAFQLAEQLYWIWNKRAASINDCNRGMERWHRNTPFSVQCSARHSSRFQQQTQLLLCFNLLIYLRIEPASRTEPVTVGAPCVFAIIIQADLPGFNICGSSYQAPGSNCEQKELPVFTQMVCLTFSVKEKKCSV